MLFDVLVIRLCFSNRSEIQEDYYFGYLLYKEYLIGTFDHSKSGG
jgi:hypothetical protein